MNNELKPCPFCGSTPRISENKLDYCHILYGIGCFGNAHHTAEVGWFPSEDEAIEYWNRRVSDEAERT